jgi:HSP20 family molecular chaperone IbpA
MNTSEFRGLFPSIISNSLLIDSELDKAFYSLPDFLKSPDNHRVHEADSEWKLEISLPGSTKDSVNVSLKEGNKLCVEVTEETDRNNGFLKKFKLPASAESDSIEAEMKDGLLVVRIPKKKAYQDRLVNVK